MHVYPAKPNSRTLTKETRDCQQIPAGNGTAGAFAALADELDAAQFPAVSERYQAGPLQAFLAREANRHKIWIVGATIPLQTSDKCKVCAACLLYSDRGELIARYDKIHLFDVTVEGDAPRCYRESLTVEPGTQVVVANTPFGKLGLAICYDLRFPSLDHIRMFGSTP
jgi:nitrilase